MGGLNRCVYDSHQHNLLNVNNLTPIAFLQIHRSEQPLKSCFSNHFSSVISYDLILKKFCSFKSIISRQYQSIKLFFFYVSGLDLKYPNHKTPKTKCYGIGSSVLDSLSASRLVISQY